MMGRLGDTQVSNTSSIYKFGDVGGGGKKHPSLP